MTDETFGSFPNDDTVVTDPIADDVTARFAPISDADVAALGGEPAGEDGRKRSKLPWIVTLVVLVLLVAAAVGGFFAARWYFADRVAPGVSFGTVKVTGQTRDELTATVRQAVKDSAITVTDAEGQKVTASLEDLGVDVDVDETVNSLLEAKAVNGMADEFTRINPFARHNVSLAASTDEYTLTEYLADQLVAEDQRAVPASISYDANAKAFVAAPGNQGRAPQTDGVKRAVDEAIANPGKAATVSVDYETVDMPISNDTATAAANDANARLTNPIVITADSGESLTIPAEQIAQWVQPQPDLKNGTLTLAYDEAAIKTYLADAMPKALDREMVKEQNITDKSGKVLYTSVRGRDGVAVENTDATAGQVIDALNGGQGSTIQAQAKVTKFETDSRVVDYSSPNGDPHAKVDLTNQMTYFYKGSTLVNSFPIASGKLSTPSDPGTFFVHTKYLKQTMRGGSGADAYVTPDVPWVTYYNGGEAFHGAPWSESYYIPRGQPVSHGCLNMNVADAKWVYNFLPIGSMVEVYGHTPTGPVR